METLVDQTKAYVRAYMGNYDASHDWSHIQRVLHLAQTIHASERKRNPDLKTDKDIVSLAALLHDVGDRKYLLPGQDGTTLVSTFLQENSCPADIADKVQLICTNVSWSNETKNPEQVARLCAQHPELKIVQDADRLDAIGAIGIARMFVFTGAKEPGRGLSIEHFSDKLLKIESRMKTETGKEIARQRTERLKIYKEWYLEETNDDSKCSNTQDI